MMEADHDERIVLLQGGRRAWWDVSERQMIPSATIYIPFGCPDWGETNGARNQLCTFCALPNSVRAYREVFYDGRSVPDADHVAIFAKTLHAVVESGEFHTLMIFNAGSFLAMSAEIQTEVMREVTRYSFIKRIVIESRAPLVTHEVLSPLVVILASAGIHLTVRIGVESKDDHLRLKILKKGHSRRQLAAASKVLHELGITVGGYALLNPAPGLDRSWAEEEAASTIEWILNRTEGLGMDEVYFGATCVGPSTKLAVEWEEGRFVPSSLRSVLRVLLRIMPECQERVHLLPFADEPAFLSVPSNHVRGGIPESLVGAEGCDLAFHAMFATFRSTMDHSLLHHVPCSCNS